MSAAEDLLDEYKGLTPAAAVGRAVALGGSGVEVVQRLFDLAHVAYWKRKDLPAAVVYSLAGIRRALAEAEGAGDGEEAEKLLGLGKATAFNLASYTWPGWEEPGIKITATDLAAGRDAAGLNLRLAMRLNRPAVAVANAHWMVGAHALSAGDYDGAMASFWEYLAVAPTEEHRCLAEGYVAVAMLAAGREVSGAEGRFEAAVVRLRVLESDDGKFFADQLVSVRKFFIP